LFVVILIIFILAGGVLAVLAFENFATLTIEVHVKIFGWHAPALPLGLLLLLVFLTGALLLYIVTVLSAWKDRRQLARLRRRVEELEQAHADTPPYLYSYPQQHPRAPSRKIPMPGVRIREHTPPSWLNS
jgi:uncharacterized integral membrane protein